ncbi:MAG: hypothetical protein V4511_04820 [Bacteroidota bacterium]
MKKNSVCNAIGISVSLHILMFLYIYSVQLKGIPFGLGTRIFIALLGLVAVLLFFLLSLLNGNKTLKIKENLFTILVLLGLIASISILSVLINGTSDFEFIKYMISIILILFACYFITSAIRGEHKDNSFSVLSDLIINVVLIQVILSLLMFLIPSFKITLNNIQLVSDFDKLKLDEAATLYRLSGFGAKFFGAGIVNGYALMLIAAQIKLGELSYKRVIYLSIVFLIILVFGMMMARTTVIGALLAFIIVTFPSGLKIKLRLFQKKLFFMVSLVILPLVATIVLFFIFPKFADTLKSAFNFGFKIFLSNDNGGGDTETLSQLKDMYIWPSSLRTYIIGDGYYTNPTPHPLYYMNTDVGYLRLIYYFGLIGMLSYVFLQFSVIRMALEKNAKFKMFFYMTFVYLLILNFKGFSDLLFLSVLFLMI